MSAEPTKTTAVDDAREENAMSLYPSDGPSTQWWDEKPEDEKPDDPDVTIGTLRSIIARHAATIDGLQAKVAELETQLRQEREAHREQFNAAKSLAESVVKMDAQVSQLHATISQLRGSKDFHSQMLPLWDKAVGTVGYDKEQWLQFALRLERLDSVLLETLEPK